VALSFKEVIVIGLEKVPDTSQINKFGAYEKRMSPPLATKYILIGVVA
jgi:hypothetical protein